MAKKQGEKRVEKMWVIGEQRVGSVVFRKDKKLILYRDKPQKKNLWDLIRKVEVILPIVHRK